MIFTYLMQPEDGILFSEKPKIMDLQLLGDIEEYLPWFNIKFGQINNLLYQPEGKDTKTNLTSLHFN